MNYKITGNRYYLGWYKTGGWFRIAELYCNRDADSILMEFNFMAPWTNAATSSIKVEVGWFNRKVILENTKNIPSKFDQLQYDGIRIYESSNINNTIYIDVHMSFGQAIAFEACQYSADYNESYSRATILDFGLRMDDELDTSVYTVLKQIDINKTSDTYTSTLSRISTLESKVSALESSTS